MYVEAGWRTIRYCLALFPLKAPVMACARFDLTAIFMVADPPCLCSLRVLLPRCTAASISPLALLSASEGVFSSIFLACSLGREEGTAPGIGLGAAR